MARRRAMKLKSKMKMKNLLQRLGCKLCMGMGEKHKREPVSIAPQFKFGPSSRREIGERYRASCGERRECF